MNLAQLVNNTIFRTIFVVKPMLNIRPSFDITLSVFSLLTKSPIYILELIVYVNYLQINIF